MAAIWYRVRQFGQALVARVLPEEYALVQLILPAQALDLFMRMPRQDQRHGLDVVRCLQDQGFAAPELLAAGLLHDVAKTEGVRTWHRVTAVLLSALRPGWLERVASDHASGWRRAFWVQLHHAQRGAELLEAVGCSKTTVELVRRHHASEGGVVAPMNGWLAALRAADRECG